MVLHSWKSKYLSLCVICVLNPVFLAVGETPDETENEIEKIEVSSTKRLDFTKDISGSISAITNQQIAESGIDDLSGITQSLAGITLTQPLKNRATINIRGINTDIGETQLTQDPVGVYFNNMPLVGSYAEVVLPDISLFDIDRVEVLRGPQSTYFGSGNIAGSVHIIANQPDVSRFDAGIRVDFADGSNSGDRKRYDAMLNVPLIEDELALRLVASKRDDQGWVENIRLGTSNASEENQLRLGLLWQPTSELSIDLSVLDVDSQPESADGWDPTLRQFVRSSPVNDGRAFDLQIYNLNVEFILDNVGTLTSSTNRRDQTANWFTYFGPFGDIGDLINTSVLSTDSLSQEFRLTSLPSSAISWVTGIYWLDSEVGGLYKLNVPGLQNFVNGLIPNRLAADTFFSAESIYSMKEKAVFADAIVPFAKDWELSFGARYLNTDVQYKQSEQLTFDFNAFDVVPIPDFLNAVKDNDWAWRGVIAYKPDIDQHYYLNYSKGVRAAQVNPNNGVSVVDPTDVVIQENYQSDSLYNLELGAKLTWLSGRVQTNIALYRLDWRDIQVDALRLSDSNNYIANAGDALSYGIEFEMQAALSDSLQGYFAMAWQDATVDDISAQQSLLSGALSGDQLPGTPEWMLNAGLTKRWSLQQGYMLSTRLDAVYVDQSVNRFSNLSGAGLANPDFAINQAYSNINASISIQAAQWSVTLYGENLSDNDKVILNIGQTQPNPAITLRPRMFGVRFEYSL